MTQILLNTLNSNLQEMLNKPSLNNIEKSLKNIDKNTIKNDLNVMDKTANKESMNFDKVFNKQLAKESGSNKISTKEVETCQVFETNSSNNANQDVVNSSTSEVVDSSQIVSEIKTLGEIKDLKLIDLKNIMNTIAQEIEGVIDCNNSTETLATLNELLAQVEAESTAESSLDLTLARDINEVINQLQKVVEQIADKIQTTTEDSCTAIVEDLISNIDDDIDSEMLLEQAPNVSNDVDSSDLEQSLEELNVLREQLLAYVNKIDTQVKTQDDSLTLSKDIVVESEDLEIEFSSDVIEFNTEVMDFGVVEKPVVKSSNVSETSEFELPLDEEGIKELNIESIKAETNTSGNDASLMGHQTPEEYSVRASLNQDLEAFEIKLDKTTEVQNFQQVQSKPVEITPSKIIEQITKQMEGLQNSSKVNIVLNPESLGKVTIQLLKTGEGLSAQFTVASHEVKDMLMKGLDGLKETLTAQGVGVDNVTIKLNDTQKSSYNSDWTEQEGSRGGNKEQQRSNKDEKHKELFEQLIAQSDDENGNV